MSKFESIWTQLAVAAGAIVAGGSKTAAYFEEGIESTGVPGLGYRLIKWFFQGSWHILINFPRYIRLLMQNMVVFATVFAILVVIGKLDWLLDDVIGLVTLSALLTYATYR